MDGGTGGWTIRWWLWDDFERIVQERYEEEASKDEEFWDDFNQSPIQPEVNLPFSDSDDSNDEFVWQDDRMKKAMEEYSDDDCLDGLGILMQ